MTTTTLTSILREEIEPKAFMNLDDIKSVWIDIALKYVTYRLKYYHIEPDTDQSRGVAEDIAQMTGINAGEMARFVNALLRDHIGSSFTRERGAQIAIAWCRGHKAMVTEESWYSREIEDALICNTAIRIGVDPSEALAFNDYLRAMT